MSKKAVITMIVFLIGAGFLPISTQAADSYKFDFGPGKVEPGYVQVLPSTQYTKELGYGFTGDTAAITATDRGNDNALQSDFCTSEKPFFFTIDLPEGNYNVAVTLGDAKEATTTTVKAELRRLMLEKIQTEPGKFVTRTFTVNIRTPKITGGGEVHLKDREKTSEALAWDDKLTLEFNDKRPCVCALEITPAPEATTVFILGDSTVCDQPVEPWAGWGEMLPRFFKPGIAVANNAESGETLGSSFGAKRLDKVVGSMKPGDYLFIQYGHNDSKEKSVPTYEENLKKFIAAFKGKGGNPVLVTSMERRRFADGKPQPTLAEYAEAVRKIGKEENVPVIDLNAMSLKFYEALGPENSAKAFVHYPANTFPGQEKELKDDTHHNAYGAYELAKCIVEGIKANVPDLASRLQDGLPAFDPSQPDPVESWSWPASPFAVTAKPEGN